MQRAAGADEVITIQREAGCDPEIIDVRLTGAGYTRELIEIAGQLGVRVIEGPAELP
jgi:hypothetical protein